jgi:predicted RNase H-like nuclease (RuvC/YqgF family)
VEKEELVQVLTEVVATQVDLAIERSVLPRFDRLETAVDAVAAEIHQVRMELFSIKAAVRRLEDRMDLADADRRELSEVRNRVAELERRVAEIEANR